MFVKQNVQNTWFKTSVLKMLFKNVCLFFVVEKYFKTLLFKTLCFFVKSLFKKCLFLKHALGTCLFKHVCLFFVFNIFVNPFC